MDYFNFKNGQLFAEEVPLIDIAKQFGTPCFIYSRATFTRHWHAFDSAFGEFPHRVCYAMKANSNLAVLDCLNKLGSSFDIVSGGELARAMAAGVDGDRIVFSGVGKQAHEMINSLDAGIHCFNIESAAELKKLQEVARSQNKIAPIAIRVNPDIDANTHPYISTGLKDNKFGVSMGEALELFSYAHSQPEFKILGITCHIGSQLTELKPLLDALDNVLGLIDKLESLGINIQHCDMGGGLGVRYDDEQPPEPREYAQEIIKKLGDRKLEIYIEPGRGIAANAGILLTQVEYIKPGETKNFAIVDAAMNDMLRPSLYNSWHDCLPVIEREGEKCKYDIVGPVCESGDFLAKDRKLVIHTGDLLALRGAGAYGFAMSSNYNSRPRAAEVMVDGDKSYLIRQRESMEDLFRTEQCLPN